MPRTGIGATLVITGGAGFTARYKSISALSFTVDVLDDTSLSSTTFYESVPDDLAKIGPITATYYCNLESELPEYGTVITATLTFPIQPDSTTAAIITGTATISRVDLPELTAGTLLMGALELTFDGKTGPTFTNAT